MNKSFWKNKKVLITGDTGFKGAWMSLVLSEAGAKIQGLSSSKFNKNIELYDCLKIRSITNTVDADIRDREKVFKTFVDFQPELVFHLAAQPLVRESYIDPVTTYEVNLMGTLNILEAIRSSSSVKSAIMVTTDKCYENNEWDWGYRETDPLGGHDPYSSSKGCAELLIKSYQKSFFHNPLKSPGVSSVRAGNVIGGGDFSQDRLIPDLYRSIDQKSKLFLRNPFATRPWQHVFEPISGYICVAENLHNSGSEGNDSWNFGPHIADIKTVKEISELFCASWEINQVIEFNSDVDQLHEAQSLSLDISKAFHRLNWQPKWSVEDSIHKTAMWYKSYHHKEDVLSLSISQIQEYFSN